MGAGSIASELAKNPRRRSRWAIARARLACCNHIAMKTRRRLRWDPVKERFPNDEEANRMLSRPQRKPYTFGSNFET